MRRGQRSELWKHFERGSKENVVFRETLEWPEDSSLMMVSNKQKVIMAQRVKRKRVFTGFDN